MKIVVGGVSQLFQGDLDLGRHVMALLRERDLPHEALLEDFDYGAVAVSQRLADLAPDVLILVGAEQRGRAPGAIGRHVVGGQPLDSARGQQAIEGAATGYVAIDLVVDVLRALRQAPPRTVIFEVEPADTGPSAELSPIGKRALEAAVARIHDEIEMTPLLILCGDLRQSLSDGHLDDLEVGGQIRRVLDGVAAVEDGGPWGGVFAGRDRLRLLLADSGGSEMRHLDWGLAWALVEELGRLRKRMAGRST